MDPRSPSSFLNPHLPIEITRHRLPHWRQQDVVAFVTWRLADAIPASLARSWSVRREGWLKTHPQPWCADWEAEYRETFTRPFENWLDSGMGSCLLRQPGNRSCVEEALHLRDGESYLLDSYVIMPNHVHVLFAPGPGASLAHILQGWKGRSSRGINLRLGQSGRLWQRDYFDCLMRSEAQRVATRGYIERNPHKARLREGDYTWYRRPRDE